MMNEALDMSNYLLDPMTFLKNTVTMETVNLLKIAQFAASKTSIFGFLNKRFFF